MAVPVYFNELSLCGYVPVGEEWNVARDLVKVLKALKQHGVDAVCTDTDFSKARISSRISMYDVFNSRDKNLDMDDVVLLVMMLTTVTGTYKQQLEDWFVTAADCGGTPVLGLAIASQMVCDGVCLSLPQSAWTESEYQIHLKWFDDNLDEQESESPVKNVHSVISVEQCPLLELPKVEYPTSGRVLCQKRRELYPHLEFSKQAQDQMKAMKSSEQVQQVCIKLADMEIGAQKMTADVLRPDLFVYRANRESKTRERTISELKIMFEDGKKRLCSWHQYFEPGEGRIYFCSDVEKPHTILVGYIGEKLGKS